MPRVAFLANYKIEHQPPAQKLWMKSNKRFTTELFHNRRLPITEYCAWAKQHEDIWALQ